MSAPSIEELREALAQMRDASARIALALNAGDFRVAETQTARATELHAKALAALSELEALRKEREELRRKQVFSASVAEGLAEVFALMEEGFLVRSTENDRDPLWALNAIRFVQRLKDAHDALEAYRSLQTQDNEP